MHPDELNHKLNHQHELLHWIKEGMVIMSAALDRLTADVADTKTAVASLIAVVDDLAAQVKNAADDSTALNALSDQLDQVKTDISTAVVANTPEPPAV